MTRNQPPVQPPTGVLAACALEQPGHHGARPILVVQTEPDGSSVGGAWRGATTRSWVRAVAMLRVRQPGSGGEQRKIVAELHHRGPDSRLHGSEGQPQRRGDLTLSQAPEIRKLDELTLLGG
jgi:hypothetical protein